MTKAIHFICRKEPGSLYPNGVTKVEGSKGVYVSRAWDLPIEAAQSLVGGIICLHAEKAAPSHFGGRVLEVRPTTVDDAARTNRVEFVFEASPEGKSQKWRGADHGMAWTSRIIDIEDS